MKRYMHKIAQMQVVEVTRRNKIGLMIINEELDGDIKLNWFWRVTLLEFENLQQLYRRYRDSICPGSPLPRKVDDALGALELVLVNEARKRSKQLEAIIAQRPGFRHIYASGPVAETAPGSGVYQSSVLVKKEFTAKDGVHSPGQAHVYRTERLWWILLQLQGPPDSETRFRYPMLLDMLNEHLMSSSPTERARLDEILYEKLSDYVTLLELLWVVRMNCPRNTNHTIEQCARTEDRLFWKMVRSRSNTKADANTEVTINALGAFQAAIPPSGPRNRVWLEKFQALHDTLGGYWSKTFTLYRQMYEGLGLQGDDVETSV
jgi:hypothetical protein